MAQYDYKNGKSRIENILDDRLEVVEQNKLPHDEEFTFDNGYYSWVSAIFVDIRNSSSLFQNGNKEIVSKIIRSFTSEVIEVLRMDDNLREIGIRGDCVYAIYTTPQKADIRELYYKTAYINTYMRMLNKLLSYRGCPNISVGIGMASAQELVVKAGRKDVGINNKVWIGDAVSMASNLSSIANRNMVEPIAYSSIAYNNMDVTEKEKSWFHLAYLPNGKDAYYHGNIVITDFDNWINEGMPD